MRYKRKFLSAIIALFLSTGLYAADTYQIDTAHTSVAFSIRHMTISTVRGSFQDFSGTLLYDEQNLANSSVDVTIQAASINTDNEKRDTHLKSADFFDVEKYPTLTFKSKQIKKQDDGFVAVGDLTMHGVTKVVEIPFTFIGKVTDPWGKTRIGFDGETSLNRKDYGLTWGNVMDNGGLVVGEEVKISLSVQAIKE